MNQFASVCALVLFTMDSNMPAITATQIGEANTEAVLIQQQRTIEALQIQVEVLTSKFLAQEESYRSTFHHLDKELNTLRALTRQILPKTCEGLKELGLTENGEYWIDPDGPFAGSGPLSVECDFDTGTTIVNHDLQDSLPIELCGEPGCFNRTVSYNAPDLQLRNLVASSESCTQRIEYNCYSAPLSENFLHWAWWTGQSADAQIYWTGYHPGRHLCECGEELNCINNGACNCDAKYPEWFQDAGEITGEELPIKQVFFGGLIFSDQQANFTLGPLQCRGKAPLKQAESCTQLRTNGAISSGFYWVTPKENSYKLTHCDLSVPTSDFLAQQDTGVTLDG